MSGINRRKCCCDVVDYYLFRNCYDGLESIFVVPATDAPFVPSVGTPWTVWSDRYQACLYTIGEFASPGTILTDQVTISDCSLALCVDPPVDPPVEIPDECGCGPGVLTDQMEATLTVTPCTCVSGGVEVDVILHNTTLTLKYLGSCAWKGRLFLEFQRYNVLFGACNVPSTLEEEYAEVQVSMGTGDWVGDAFVFRASDGMAYSGNYLLTSDHILSDCTSASLPNLCGVGDCSAFGSCLAYGGTLDVAVKPVLPP